MAKVDDLLPPEVNAEVFGTLSRMRLVQKLRFAPDDFPPPAAFAPFCVGAERGEGRLAEALAAAAPFILDRRNEYERSLGDAFKIVVQLKPPNDIETNVLIMPREAVKELLPELHERTAPQTSFGVVIEYWTHGLTDVLGRADLVMSVPADDLVRDALPRTFFKVPWI